MGDYITIERTIKRPPFRLTELAFSGPEELRGYCIAFLTDFHYGPATGAKHLRQAIKIVSEYQPDLVCLGGDYVQSSPSGLRSTWVQRIRGKKRDIRKYFAESREYARGLNRLLSELAPRHGMLGVLGNHEYHEGRNLIKRALSPTAEILVNQQRQVSVGEATVRVIGLDDIRYGEPNLPDIEPPSPSDKLFTVVLAHSPDTIDQVDFSTLAPPFIVLSGHTHAGQIQIPGLGAPITRIKNRSLLHGLHPATPGQIYVSAGLGYGGIPLRLFCDPEIVIIRAA